VPAWLPALATEIRTAHNIDNNYYMVSFKLPKGTQLSLPTECTQVPPRSPKEPPFKRPWWPGDVPANGWSTHRHAFAACRGYFVAHSASLGEGFVWSSQ
jgi:hypothetical protein